MTFALPTVNDNCAITRGATDPLWVADINSPTNTGVKANGSLPHPDSATEFDNNANGSTKGYAKEFTNGGAGEDVSADTKLLLWANQFNAPNRIQVDTVANGGVILRIFSGTVNGTNYRDFYVGGNNTPNAASVSGQYPYVIDLNSASHDASSGTFDNTDVTGVAVLTTRLDMAGTNTNWNYQSKMWIVDTTKTSSDTPTFSGSGAVFQDMVTEIQGTDYTNKLGSWVRQVGSAIFVDIPFRIGNNSTITTFDDEGKTIVSAVHNDSSDPRVRVTTQGLRTYLNLRNNAADTAAFSGTWTWQTRAAFDWDQDDAAVVTFSSPTFRGMGQFTLGSSITGPATWDDVDLVTFADTGVDVDGSTFKSPNGNHLLGMTAGAMDIANMRFESYASKHAILIDTAGTYNFSNVFFDGSGTNEVETTHSSGVVTINISNGGTTPGVTQTGAGTYVVNNNVTVKVTVKSALTLARIENARVYVEADVGGPLPAGESVTIAISGSPNVAVVTHSAHGLVNGVKVRINGANENAYNGVHQIQFVDANTYEYDVSGSPSSPATGSITSTAVILDGLTATGSPDTDSGFIQDTAFNFSSNQPVTGRARKSSASPYYQSSTIAGTITSGGLDVDVFMILDE